MTESAEFILVIALFWGANIALMAWALWKGPYWLNGLFCAGYCLNIVGAVLKHGIAQGAVALLIAGPLAFLFGSRAYLQRTSKPNGAQPAPFSISRACNDEGPPVPRPIR